MSSKVRLRESITVIASADRNCGRPKCRDVKKSCDLLPVITLMPFVQRPEALDKRALDVRRMLRARSEELVTVVCHAVGLHCADAYVIA